ncbi:hypothetical protein ACWPMX_07785 [Tsuneonella sp. HG094]
MSRAPDGVVAFEYDGSRYEMVFDMKAIAFFEREADMSIIEVLGDLEAAREEARAPKVAGLAFLMQAGLRRHHPEVSPERALRMAGDPAVQAALGSGVSAAMPDAPADDAGAEGNAKAATAKPTKASTGTRRSKGRSKQG